MANWTGVITNAGSNVLTQWVNENVLNINSAASGQGTVATAALLAQTALVNQKQTASIVGADGVTGGIRLKLRITAPQAAYTLNQYGVWASVTGDPPAMIALFQHDQGIPIPSAAESPDFVFTFYALITTSNTGTWTVNIDTSVGVTAADVAEAVAAAVATKQDKITANGLLKGTGQGNVTAAAAGTDYGYPMLKGSAAPATSTVGAIGQMYLNITSGALYVCTATGSEGYTWSAVSGGAGGIADGYCSTGASTALKIESGFVTREITNGTVVGINFVHANTAATPSLNVNGIQGPIIGQTLTAIDGVELTAGMHLFAYLSRYNSWWMLDTPSSTDSTALVAAIAEGLEA